MPVNTLDYLVEYYSGGVWIAIADASILSVEGSLELAVNPDAPIPIGDDTEARRTIRTVLSIWSSLPARTKVRVDFTVNATTQRAFVGLVESRSRDVNSCTFSCVGIKAQIATTELHSPPFNRRPVATLTTASSIEDPTNGAYQAGMINWIFWSCGGRPNAQAGSYPSAIFYYHCDQAILAPEWTWVAGEDGWAEAVKLAEASLGQVYQDRDGVVRYKQPFSFAGGSSSFTFDESVYGAATENEPSAKYATKVQSSFTPRVAQAVQQVIDDSAVREVAAGATATFSLDPENPLKSVLLAGDVLTDITPTASGWQLGSDAFVVTTGDGGSVAQGAGGYDHTISPAAARLTFSVTNHLTRPITIWRITVKGEPISAGEAGSVTAWKVGTTENDPNHVVRRVNDNVNIQDRAFAQRLCEIYLVLYGVLRSRRTVEECAYDPSRTVGETVSFTCAGWSVSSAAHIILAKRDSDTGAKAGYDLVDVTGLPKSDDYYKIGSTSYSGQTKNLGY